MRKWLFLLACYTVGARLIMHHASPLTPMLCNGWCHRQFWRILWAQESVLTLCRHIFRKKIGQSQWMSINGIPPNHSLSPATRSWIPVHSPEAAPFQPGVLEKVDQTWRREIMPCENISFAKNGFTCENIENMFSHESGSVLLGWRRLWTTKMNLFQVSRSNFLKLLLNLFFSQGRSCGITLRLPRHSPRGRRRRQEQRRAAAVT